MAQTPTSAARRQRIAWVFALTLASIAAAASAEIHGRSSRARFVPPAELAGARLAAVSDVVAAFHLWQATGVRGRRLVVLTGRWSRPMPKAKVASSVSPDGTVQERDVAEQIDVSNAIFEAAALGIARHVAIVMPPAGYSQRLGAVMGQKALVREASAFRLHSNGFERRFSTPDGFEPASEETVLLLIEASWFGYDVPADPLAWLASRGVSWDLAVIATDDPVASPDQKQAAVAFATATGAVFVDPGGE